jgi:hypothetical protein
MTSTTRLSSSAADLPDEFSEQASNQVCRSEFLAQLDVYLQAMYPGCPESLHKLIVNYVRSKSRFGRLAEISAIAATIVVRHNLTDYDRLLRMGLTREEARLVVKDEIQETLSIWKRNSAERDPSLARLRHHYRKQRELNRRTPNLSKRQLKAATTALICEENSAVASCLACWTQRMSGYEEST